MAGEVAKYACDECRSRKIKCSREAAGCSQCSPDGRNCVYSRSGVIRRRTKLSKRKSPSTTSSGQHATPAESEPLPQRAGEPRSQLDEDIETIQDGLRQFGESENDANGTLATLSEEYSSFWQGPSLREMAKELGVEEKKLLPFPDEQETLFTETFVNIQSKGRPIFTLTPPEILHDLRCHPERVTEKAYLVVVYGILLTDACLDDSYDRTTITKLRWNLRLALDDAKLLLEPSELNIQALILLACHVQEVSTPSLCWMMISNACRMLQVLGVNTRTLDTETKERRLMLFWLLNGIEKNLSLVSCRSPNFHRAMCARMPLIPLQKMLDYQPHVSVEEGEDSFRSMFGAHLMRQMHLVSIVISDIWSCLFEDATKFDEVKKSLEEWWQQSSSVLQACLLAEQPFLNDSAKRSMQLGLKTKEFHYNHLKTLLIRSKPAFREECVSASQQALLVLNDLVSDSSEVYNGMIWVFLYCPFTPFFILFGEVLSQGHGPSSERCLDAMEKLSTFLARMRPRHPRAAKLHTIAATLVQYARAAMTKKSTTRCEESGTSSKREGSKNGPTFGYGLVTPGSETFDKKPSEGFDQPSSPTTQGQQPVQDVFNDPSVQALSMDLDYWLQYTQPWDGNGMDMGAFDGMQDANGTGNDPYGFFADSTFDWFSWDANLSNPYAL